MRVCFGWKEGDYACSLNLFRAAGVLEGAGAPRLVRVREPDQLGVERAHSQLAFGVRLVELPPLDVDRPAREEVVAAAVVEVQVCVDDDVDAGEVEVLLAHSGRRRGSRSATAGCSSVW